MRSGFFRGDFALKWAEKHDDQNRVNMKRKMIAAVAAFVLCALACPAWAAGFSGSYTYKLVLRDDWGLALSGTGSESVSYNYKIEVYTSGGVKLNASVADASFDG